MGKGLKVPAVFFKEKIRNFIPGIGVKICPGTDGRGDAAVPKGACTGHDLADTAFEGDHVITVVPEKLTVNVAHLGLGKTVKVGELNFEGLELMNAKEAVVCAVKLTRAARGAAAAAGN